MSHLVSEWLVEFDEHDDPWREMGLDSDGQVVYSGPDNANYGFWLDTNMKYDDFDGDEISPVEFERLWRTSTAAGDAMHAS